MWENSQAERMPHSSHRQLHALSAPCSREGRPTHPLAFAISSVNDTLVFNQS